jgi:hypothetical protein
MIGWYGCGKEVESGCGLRVASEQGIEHGAQRIEYKMSVRHGMT